MKKLVYILGITIMLMFIAGCSEAESNTEGNVEETEKYTMTISSALDEDTSFHHGLLKFKEVAEEKSQGQLAVEIFANGELYASEREAVEATQSGNIQGTITATGPLANFAEEFMVLNFMFIFNDTEDANKAIDGEVGEILNEKLEDNKLKGIGWGGTGMTQITNNKRPLETIEDFKDLKIRTMENEIHLESLKELGANPQPYAFGEIYSALQQNIFDGIQTPAQLLESSKVYEVQEYITIVDNSFDAAALIMNKEFYDSLPEELQQIVDKAGEAFTEEERILSKQYDEESIEFLTEELQANILSDEVKQEIRERLQPIMNNYEDKIGSELLDLIRED